MSSLKLVMLATRAMGILKRTLMTDRIILDGIHVMAYVGVPDEERARPQLLEISIVLHLDLCPAACTEQVSASVDYREVQQKVIEVVHQHPRHLIEAVAEDIAQALLQGFKVHQVEVEVRKFILEHTRSVAVHIVRELSPLVK